MSASSSIEWTDATWNPVRGCVKISSGCAHCYAENFAERFRGVPGHPYEQGFDPRLVPEALHLPLTWKSSRKIFVNSMSDLFYSEFPAAYIQLVIDVMEICTWHQFQVLTKRPERSKEFSKEFSTSGSHILVGVSVENRRNLPRVEDLRAMRAAKKFLSCEPLLQDLGPIDLTGIDWVIVGGESGPRTTRPMLGAWARSLRDQCKAYNVPFFFKQWGAWAPTNQLPDRAHGGGCASNRARREDPPVYLGKSKQAAEAWT